MIIDLNNIGPAPFSDVNADGVVSVWQLWKYLDKVMLSKGPATCNNTPVEIWLGDNKISYTSLALVDNKLVYKL